MPETVIWKFPLKQVGCGPTVLNIPADAKVVHAGQDPQGGLCLWVLMRPNGTVHERRFDVVGTGQRMDCEVEHIASFVETYFVWHVLEILG